MGLAVVYAVLLFAFGCHGLEMSMDRDVSPELSKQGVCGVLMCVEEISEEKTKTIVDQEENSTGVDFQKNTTVVDERQTTTSNRTTSTVTELFIMKTDRTNSKKTPESMRSTLIATVTLKKPSVDRMVHDAKVEGFLDGRQAALRLTLFKQDDCRAMFTCKVLVVDSRGTVGQSTYTLQQQTGEVSKDEFLEKVSSLEKAFEVNQGMMADVGNLFNKKLKSLDAKIDNFIDTTFQAAIETSKNNTISFLSELDSRVKELKKKDQEMLTGLRELSIDLGKLEHNLTKDIKDVSINVNNSAEITNAHLINVTSEENVWMIHEVKNVVENLIRPKYCQKGMVSVLPGIRFGYMIIYPPIKSGLSNYLCDTKTGVGGWIVIQRRATGDVDFNRSWEEYKKGFGSLTGDFWLGLENILKLQSNGKYQLRIDLVYKRKRYYAFYKSFAVGDERSKYKLKLGSFTYGNLGDSFSRHNGRFFSTYDRDNDIRHNFNCARSYFGGWWYHDCHTANLNGKWGRKKYKGPSWSKLTGGNPTSYTSMKIRHVGAVL